MIHLRAMLVRHGMPRTSFCPLPKNIPELVRTALTSEAPVSALTTPDLWMLGFASAIRNSTSAASPQSSVTLSRAHDTRRNGERLLHTVGEELVEQEDSRIPREHLHSMLLDPMVNFSQPPCKTQRNEGIMGINGHTVKVSAGVPMKCSSESLALA